MAKFKRITNKYMCLISAVVMFFSALFYPLESFRADVSAETNTSFSKNFTFNYSISDIEFDDSQFTVFPSHIESNYVSEHNDYNFFYYRGSEEYLFSTDSQYYAYEVTIIYNSVSVNNATNCVNAYGYLTLVGDYYTLDGIVTETFYPNLYLKYWYVTDFSQGEQMYYTHLYTLYESIYSDSSLGATGFNLPSVSFTGDITIVYKPYSIENLTDEIYSTLKNVYSANQSMLTKLEQIYMSLDTVETKLQSLVNIAEQIENNTDELEGLLKTCNSYLASIQSELEEQTTWLERIWNTLVDYFDTSNSQQDKVDDFANNSYQQSGSLDNLVNDMGQLEKPSVNDSASDIDKIIPNGEGFVFDVLRTVTDLSIVGDMLLLTVTMAFVAYVLFGKR